MAKFEKYKDFKLEDFINDEQFQNWVLKSKEEELDLFWKKFLDAHPDKIEVVEEAKEILLKIPFEELNDEGVPSQEQIEMSFQRVRNILGFKNAEIKQAPIFFMNSARWIAAASIILVLSL